MKKLLLLLLSIFNFQLLTCSACTNFIVGKAASDNGQTMITYAADSYSLYGFLRFQPAANHAKGEMRKVIDWDTDKYLCEIPEVEHTYSVIGNMNEHQVTIGETTFGGRIELMDTISGTIDYGSMMYIALERSRTAREALQCMTDLVAQYGYASEGESFSIADPNEVWLLELIGKGPGNKGAVWVATRIPDDAICAHANQARITRLPLDSKGKWKRGKGNIAKVIDANGMEWMWTKDIIDVARKNGCFSGKDEDFSFSDAYNPLDLVGAYGCDGRVWSFFRHFTDDMDRYLPYIMNRGGEHMPIYIHPDHKVSAAELRACMRDQFEGTPLSIRDMKSAGIWHSKLRYGGLTFHLDSIEYCYPRPTATQQTGWSYVSEMYSEKPYGIFWFGVDDAATNVYVPFFSCAKDVPEAFRKGNGDLLTYSPTSAFWAFNTVANYAYTKYERMLPDIQFRQQQWEERFAEDVKQLETKAFEMSEADRAAYLTKYSNLQAEAVVADWKDLFSFLMVKFLDGVEKRQDENGAFLRTPEGMSDRPNRLKPSEEYLRSIADEIAH
ncbi:MAG: dipeptidase [Bacteroidales bacterium]|nr:dipeptidase [Bacteroidales bacterium]